MAEHPSSHAERTPKKANPALGYPTGTPKNNLSQAHSFNHAHHINHQQRKVRRAFGAAPLFSQPFHIGFGEPTRQTPTADDWADLHADIDSRMLQQGSVPFHLGGGQSKVHPASTPPQGGNGQQVSVSPKGYVATNPMQAPFQAPVRPVRLPEVAPVKTLRVPGAVRFITPSQPARLSPASPSPSSTNRLRDPDFTGANFSGLGLVMQWVAEWFGLAEVDTQTEDTRLSAGNAVLYSLPDAEEGAPNAAAHLSAEVRPATAKTQQTSPVSPVGQQAPAPSLQPEQETFPFKHYLMAD